MRGVQLQGRGKPRRTIDAELRAAHLYIIMNSTATGAYHRQVWFCLQLDIL